MTLWEMRVEIPSPLSGTAVNCQGTVEMEPGVVLGSHVGGRAMRAGFGPGWMGLTGTNGHSLHVNVSEYFVEVLDAAACPGADGGGSAGGLRVPHGIPAHLLPENAMPCVGCGQ